METKKLIGTVLKKWCELFFKKLWEMFKTIDENCLKSQRKQF